MLPLHKRWAIENKCEIIALSFNEYNKNIIEIFKLSDYLNNMTQTVVDIQNEKRNLTNIGNIEKQVNLQTLQQNYQYMFWTILAGAAILIIINMNII